MFTKHTAWVRRIFAHEFLNVGVADAKLAAHSAARPLSRPWYINHCHTRRLIGWVSWELRQGRGAPATVSEPSQDSFVMLLVMACAGTLIAEATQKSYGPISIYERAFRP